MTDGKFEALERQLDELEGRAKTRKVYRTWNFEGNILLWLQALLFLSPLLGFVIGGAEFLEQYNWTIFWAAFGCLFIMSRIHFILKKNPRS